MEKNITKEVIVSSKDISCNGDENSKHPKIFLKISKENKVVCPYCSRIFIYESVDE